jgi:hypothetical protein
MNGMSSESARIRSLSLEKVKRSDEQREGVCFILKLTSESIFT